MNLLQVSGISRKEEGTYVLKEISFTQQEFHKTAIAGTTGSGKTTLLKIIAGLIQPQSGEVLFEGERVKGPEEKLLPGHTGIAYLSQHFELLNHYKVQEILEMNNRLSTSDSEIIYEVCRITDFLKRFTHQLSGGEKQRIALARLLVSAPRLLLLDEPYSNLDAIHKNILKYVMQDISEQLNITCLLVSHDPVDVLSWADEILVLQEGKIVQKASPEKVYNQPVNEYVAALFGKYNVMNFALAKAFFAVSDIEMNKINSFFRPQHFKIVSNANEGLQATVKRVLFLGTYYEIEISITGSTITINTINNSLKIGDVVYVTLA